MPAQETHRLRPPAIEVDGAADDHGVVAKQILDRSRQATVHGEMTLAQLVRDRLGNLDRRAALGGVGNKDLGHSRQAKPRNARTPSGRHTSHGPVQLRIPYALSLEAIPALRAETPGTQIVVLTMEDDTALVRAARRAGALGYVLKEAADADLVDAVRRAASGERYLNRRLAARLIAQHTDEHGWD
jgi:DNA-binding NarL/FixJ family response regulator